MMRLDIYSFIHVDEGLLFGPSIEVHRLIEHLTNQVMMHIVRRLAQLDGSNILSWQSFVTTARGDLV